MLVDNIVAFVGKALNTLFMSCFLWLVWNKFDMNGPLFGLRYITLLQCVIVIILIDIVADRFGVNDRVDDK